MHNRKKSEKPPSEAEVSALTKKCDLYSTLVKEVFDRRSRKDHSDETLVLVGKMLKLNPDFYSLWNFRREILITSHPQLNDSNIKLQHPEADSIRDKELKISVDGIQRNPKSYGAWYHRIWVIDRFEVDLEIELELCTTFLKQDQRNFHCWNYRRYIANKIEARDACNEPIPPIVLKELEFSQEKISENFSNYSAFHHRSIYIQRVALHRPLCELLPVELSMVESAVFTEPADQSAWWYHQFLLRWAATHSEEQWLGEVGATQLHGLLALLQVEGGCKWVLLGLLQVLGLLQRVKGLGEGLRSRIRDSLSGLLGEGGSNDHVEGLLVACRSLLLERLALLDPTHKGRYFSRPLD